LSGESVKHKTPKVGQYPAKVWTTGIPCFRLDVLDMMYMCYCCRRSDKSTTWTFCE